MLKNKDITSKARIDKACFDAINNEINLDIVAKRLNYTTPDDPYLFATDEEFKAANYNENVPITINKMKYPSLKYIAIRSGSTVEKIRKRLIRFGFNSEKVVPTFNKSITKTKKLPIVYKGDVYRSLAELAQKNGIVYQTLEYRIKKLGFESDDLMNVRTYANDK